MWRSMDLYTWRTVFYNYSVIRLIYWLKSRLTKRVVSVDHILCICLWCRHLWLLTPVRRFYHLGYSGCVYEKSWHLPVLTEAFFLLSCTLLDFRQPVGFYLYWHQLSYLCITAVVADLLVFQEVLSECFCVWINGYCMEFSVSWINVNHRSTGSNLKHHISICSLLTQWQCNAWM